MAKGKILALLGGIITLIGTFFFSLFTYGTDYNYGIGSFMGLLDSFSGSGWEGVVMSIGFLLYLLSFVLILIGIKSRAFAFIGALFPLAVMTFVLLGAFNIWVYPVNFIGNSIGGAGAAISFIPFSFDALLLAGPYTNIDLGTWIVGLGGLLALVSAFISRED